MFALNQNYLSLLLDVPIICIDRTIKEKFYGSLMKDLCLAIWEDTLCSK